MTTIAFNIQEDRVDVFTDSLAASMDHDNPVCFEYPQGKVDVICTNHGTMLATSRGLAYLGRIMNNIIQSYDQPFDSYFEALPDLFRYATKKAFQDLFSKEGATFPDARLHHEFYLFGFSGELDSFSAMVIRNYGTEATGEIAYNKVKITKRIRYFLFQNVIMPVLKKSPETRRKFLKMCPGIFDKEDLGLVEGLKLAVHFNRDIWKQENNGDVAVVSGGKIWKTTLHKSGEVNTVDTGHEIPLLPGFEVVAKIDRDGQPYDVDMDKFNKLKEKENG